MITLIDIFFDAVTTLPWLIAVSVISYLCLSLQDKSDKRVDKLLDRLMARDLGEYTDAEISMRPGDVKMPGQPKPHKATPEEKDSAEARANILSNIPSRLHGQALEYMESLEHNGVNLQYVAPDDIIDSKTLEEVENL